MSGRGARFWLRLAALVLLTLGLTLPPLHRKRPVYDAIAVLDLTASMNTADVGGGGRSRLDLEKAAVESLLDTLPCGSRLGLGIFVERVPFLLFEPMEICANATPLHQEVAALDWRMGWDSESHIAAALLAAMRMAQTEDADLLFLTDGQESPPLWWNGMPNFAPLAGSVHGAILGLGGSRLVPIPRFDSQNHPIGNYRAIDVPSDKSGLFAGHGNLTAEDAPHLRQIASLSGLTYRHLGAPADLAAALYATARRRTRRTAFDPAPIAAAAALLLLALSHAPWPGGPTAPYWWKPKVASKRSARSMAGI